MRGLGEVCMYSFTCTFHSYINGAFGNKVCTKIRFSNLAEFYFLTFDSQKKLYHIILSYSLYFLQIHKNRKLTDPFEKDVFLKFEVI